MRRWLATLALLALAVAVVLLQPGPSALHGPFTARASTGMVRSGNLVFERTGDVVSSQVLSVDGTTTLADEGTVYVVVPARFSTANDSEPIDILTLDLGGLTYVAKDPEQAPAATWVEAMPHLWTERTVVFRVASSALRDASEVVVGWQTAAVEHPNFGQRVELVLDRDEIVPVEVATVGPVGVSGAWNG